MIEPHQTDRQKSRYARPQLGPAKSVEQNWTVHHFVGKYHLSRIKNVAPIPGIQLAQEIKERDDRRKDAKRFEDELEQRAAVYRKTVRARDAGAQKATQLHMDTLVGIPMNDIESTLNSRLSENSKKNYYCDTPQQIKQFKKNVILNRPNYIGYAVITTGFRSFAWQDEDTGNSFVHLAVQLGHVDVLAELLKYKCDPNLINKLGNSPLHDAWYQWIPPPNNSDIRQAQEEKTCKILRHLLEYNAYPDCLQKTDGCTALHMAARLGPTRAVLILLGFKADHTVRNRAGQTPIEVAAAHGQIEIVKVLRNWDVMKKTSAAH